MTTDLAGRAGRYLIVGVDPEGTGELPPILELLTEVRPLGVILFARNMPDRPSLDRLISAIRAHDPHLLLAIDHEGGRVHRLPPPFTYFAPALTLLSNAVTTASQVATPMKAIATGVQKLATAK